MDRAAWGRNGPVSALGGSHFGAEMGTGDRLDLEGGLRELLSFASVSLISRSRRDDMTGFWNMEHGTCLSSLARRKECTRTGKEAMCAGESESACFPPWPPYGVSKEWKALIGTCTTTLQKSNEHPLRPRLPTPRARQPPKPLSESERGQMGSVVVEWAPPLLAAAPCPFRGAAMDLHQQSGVCICIPGCCCWRCSLQSVCLRDLV
jgi:hypothetical protein